ncbi:retinoic acid receptor responder protein 1 [Elgaria multicarinata webbii]|uniref:retinoic acid receptor responder protein 1 n=1 Tax=Elgaria multicarinata webbii TaxID=159646 RepID=UPI002FCD38F9
MQRLTASLLLLALFASSARGTDQDDDWLWSRSNPTWQQRRSRGALDVSSLQVARVAQTAVQYFNYLQGSPSSLRELGHVKKASVKTIPGVGRKYFLQFVTKDVQTRQNLGTCLATVLYQKQNPKPQVEMSCVKSKDTDQRLQDDHSLYLSIRNDNEPSASYLRLLASLGSNYIAWEKSTEGSAYTMSQVKDVKQWTSPDDALEFDFTVQLDSDASESLFCQMRIVWQLGEPLKVKYDCSGDEQTSGSADGSGDDLEFTGWPFIDPENNF